MFDRNILKELNIWKNSNNRKPLILRGARQVGKTVAVNIFARNYDNYAYLDLQKKEDLNIFHQNLSIDDLIQMIALKKNINLNEGQCLIFIDEIQNSAEATVILRYFYEQRPDIHIIAAGSLLEIMMEHKQISFPVGRVEYRYLYPVNFAEFLNAIGKDQALNYYQQIPVSKIAHKTLLDIFHKFTQIGGMPEIIQTYSENPDIQNLQRIYESLITTYLNDVVKYAKSKSSIKLLRHGIESSPLEAGKRIKFQGFGNSDYRSREMGEVLRTLERAMLIKLLYPTTNVKLPIQPSMRKSPRLQFLDTGLLNYKAGLQVAFFEYKNLHNIYKGIIAEHIVYQEIISSSMISDIKPAFWTRESKQSNAEVDYLLPFRNLLIPVEIKSGKTGALRSLHQFMDKVNHKYAIRLYAGELKIEHLSTQKNKPFKLLNLPYYLAGKLHEYAAWFVKTNE